MAGRQKLPAPHLVHEICAAKQKNNPEEPIMDGLNKLLKDFYR
jgi:hypothetical protein